MNLRLELFCVYDVKVETYFPPFPAQNKMEALRQFGDLLTDGSSRLAKHPEDYRLYVVGQFDTITGVVAGYATGPVLVEEGLAMVTPKLAKES